MIDPYVYVEANVLGHVTLLEAARRLDRLEHLVFASSSSVYGLNGTLPFRETDRVDSPNSLYAATKRAGELMSHAYGHLYGLRQTGLRFFTVYGPWGRPDMAYYGFARAIAAGEPVTLYEGEGLARDFTYIDDVVDGVLRVLDLPPDPAAGCAAPAQPRQPAQRAGVAPDRAAGAGARPARGRSACCRGRRPTWWRPGPRSTRRRPSPAGRRGRRWTRGCRGSSTGSATYHGPT